MFEVILSKWAESLSFFKKDSLKSFFLASLNNAFRSIILLFKNFWLLGLLLVVFGVALYFLTIISRFIQNFTISIIFNFIFSLPLYIGLFLLIFTFLLLPFLLVRASSENKNFAYLKRMFGKNWGILILIFFMFILPMIILGPSYYVNIGLFAKFLLSIWSTVFLFTVFFYLDEKTIFASIFKSFIRGLKVFIYFLPVILFLSLIFWILTIISDVFRFNEYLIFAYSPILYIVFFVMSLFLGIVFYCLNLSFIANYYSILRHKYYKFFYE
ncbi:MAG: hypothetical protein SZ59_C0003G0091 [candidate division TM6 bacterium GW2011_GWF2_28_16]|nr:MAG: hypothetical protein SZ59_C0003G0091 [candidate division TM6 bacterium GW2011_GWF2_28_16]